MPSTCSIANCTNVVNKCGLCWKHYRQRPNAPKHRCAVSGCQRQQHCKRFCTLHYDRFRQHGDPNTLLKAPGGSGHSHQGYLRRTRNGVRVFDHRLIWEAANGPIPAGHHIHHINGDRGDNRLENLQCLRAGQHMSLHQRGRPRGPRSAATKAKISAATKGRIASAKAKANMRLAQQRLAESKSAIMKQRWATGKLTITPEQRARMNAARWPHSLP